LYFVSTTNYYHCERKWDESLKYKSYKFVARDDAACNVIISIDLIVLYDNK